MTAKRRKGLTVDSLHEYVEVEGECWIWQLAPNPQGYGKLTQDNKNFYAHRAVYELFLGPIPSGFQLDHLCRVRMCCNPDHLEPVTPFENARRSPIKYPAYCFRGHRLAGGNIIERKGQPGTRKCVKCAQLRDRTRGPAAEQARRDLSDATLAIIHAGLPREMSPAEAIRRLTAQRDWLIRIATPSPTS